MVKLRAGFRSDLMAMARKQLAADWGTETAQLSDDEILINFFDSIRRRPSIRPRRLWVADDFRCPPEHEGGWKALQLAVIGGKDLRPHLSSRHANLNTLDGLLNEWGVHHLHLGTAIVLGASTRVERSGAVLFARITDDDFFAIDIYPHGAWESLSVLESLHRNWPDAIKQYRIRGLQGEPLTEVQRRSLRRKNVQAATTTSDGTVYMAIGGGVTSSGRSAEAIMRADMLWSDTDQLQLAVQVQIEKFMPHLQAAGYTDQSEIEATLVEVTPEVFRVAFSDYGVLSNVTLDGGWFHRKRLGLERD
jgi:hypothetical protein